MSPQGVFHGDSRDVLDLFESSSLDACITDPPYALVSIGKRFGKPGAAPAKSDGATGVYARASAGFMGQQWDTGETAFDPTFWAEVLRVLKPGAHLLAFGGTRTFHRLAVAIEDAGFEIRDTLMWVYGSGFPKSHNLDDQWGGWGTALKPAWEPIIMARKPLVGTVAANVLAHGTGALNIDGCRVYADDAQGGEYTVKRFAPGASVNKDGNWKQDRVFTGEMKPGRWPANVIHDGSEEVVSCFPNAPGQQGDLTRHAKSRQSPHGVFGAMKPAADHLARGDSGSAARFFYCAKASKADRAGSKHPTVKPIALLRYLCRLVTPPGGTILDPFAGSGTLGQAAYEEGFNYALIEREAQYVADTRRRLAGEDVFA